MSKVGFKMIHGHNYATWELKILKFSNFGQNHFSDFETPFSVGLTSHSIDKKICQKILLNAVTFILQNRVMKFFWTFLVNPSQNTRFQNPCSKKPH